MNLQNLRPKVRRQKRLLAQDELRRKRYAPMVRAQMERNRNDVRSTSDHVQVLRVGQQGHPNGPTDLAS